MTSSRKVRTSDEQPNYEPIKLIIANVGGPNDGVGTADKRKKIISALLNQAQPNVVLFQEFGWKGISGYAWRHIPIPDRYEYTGNKDASILFDKNELTISMPVGTELQRLLDEMIRRGTLRIGFTPLPRMCVRIVETKGVPKIKFICISWHGRYKGRKKNTLIEELSDVFKYATAYSDKKEIPFLLAGDFNLEFDDVKKLVYPPLRIYHYTPIKRREGKVIDYYVGSDEIHLQKVHAIDWKSVPNSAKAYRIFDHDPVFAELKYTSSLASSPISKEKK